MKREAGTLEYLSQTELCIPKVYQFVSQEESAGEQQAWLLMECLRGETIRKALTHEYDPRTRHRILFNFGENLRALHTTPCPEGLKRGGSWLDHMLAQAEFNLQHYEVDGSSELLEKLRTSKPGEAKQTLIHGDFTIDNVLVHEGSVTGIIDWSSGAFGDPRYDVSLAIRPKPNLFQSPEDRHAFFAGYGDQIITDEEYEYFEKGLYAFF